MNNWNIAILDDLFGHGDKQRSRISQKVQGFDNETGEHVVRIEYRVKLANEGQGGLIRSANDRLIRSNPDPRATPSRSRRG
ncbi:hypothetical protein XFUD_03315 [Xylella fastidiosa]|uniref:Uncharacterized protein n=1 Tax=Xylella fastidiosa (strain 9a5c) TaxID=160492 RepID=Q9PF98_XYLFA|nr:hypothetical protein [Xylella fastidiosa]AAF83590.1 hypothetical protein XF_0780 [Xylella fastidiosa 9a5c]ETE29839.1 hypothetical protein B398_10885 [Xylella fastidiosa 32]OCA58494.1 hypothetical protein AA93_03280 [Xylella fastidiosa subsp. pauca 11399]ALQ94341.1 hypothetical protein XFUD_03315 [Xylella fastidiosa]ALR02682.1 hypothetical protein OY18_11295 [Xylella fastidiosa]